MRYLLVLIAIMAGSVLSFFSPIYAVCLLLWQDIFQPLSFAFHFGEIPLAMYTIALLAISYFYHLFRGNLHPILNVFIFQTVLFLLWILVCTLVSPYVSAMPGFVKVLKYLIPLLFISTMVASRRDAELIMATLMFSVGLWAAAAGVLGPIHGAYPFLNIEGGQMGDNNEVAAATVGYLPFCLYFIFNYRWRFKFLGRAGLVLLFLVSLSSIAFSQSRGAAVALAVLVLFYIVFLSRKKIRETLVIGVFVSLALYFAPSSFYERMETIEMGSTQTEASAQNRMSLMTAAWHGMQDNPIFGMGPYCWLEGCDAYTDDAHNPHDVWLKCGVELGFPGLIIFVIIIGTQLVQLKMLSNRAAKLGDMQTCNVALALMASIVGICVALSFLSQPFWEYLWAILATGAGLQAVYTRKTSVTSRR